MSPRLLTVELCLLLRSWSLGLPAPPGSSLGLARVCPSVCPSLGAPELERSLGAGTARLLSPRWWQWQDTLGTAPLPAQSMLYYSPSCFSEPLSFCMRGQMWGPCRLTQAAVLGKGKREFVFPSLPMEVQPSSCSIFFMCFLKGWLFPSWTQTYTHSQHSLQGQVSWICPFHLCDLE